MDAPAKPVLVSRQSLQLAPERCAQLLHLIGASVRQFPLDRAPHAFIGVQLGSVRRQVLDSKSSVPCQQLADGRPAMGVAVVQERDHVTPQVSQELPEEATHLLSADGVQAQHPVQTHAESRGTDRQGGDRGDPLVAKPVANHRSLTHGCPSLADGGNQEEPGFVDEDEVGAQPRSPLFTWGHRVLFHSWIARSSRSTARRSGFWGLQPRPCMSLPTWAGW